jgi:hypothetical protein
MRPLSPPPDHTFLKIIIPSSPALAGKVIEDCALRPGNLLFLVRYANVDCTYRKFSTSMICDCCHPGWSYTTAFPSLVALNQKGAMPKCPTVFARRAARSKTLTTGAPLPDGCANTTPRFGPSSTTLQLAHDGGRTSFDNIFSSPPFTGTCQISGYANGDFA